MWAGTASAGPVLPVSGSFRCLLDHQMNQNQLLQLFELVASEADNLQPHDPRFRLALEIERLLGEMLQLGCDRRW